MPISSLSLPDTILKPGVCTSSTRPSAPYEGQTIYETDTDRVMVHNGTGWVVLSEPPISFTPTVTNITTANGVLTGRYHRSDGWCEVFTSFVLGSSSAVTGRTYFGVPSGIPGATVNAFIGSGVLNDSGGLAYIPFLTFDTTSIYLDCVNASTTYGSVSFNAALLS